LKELITVIFRHHDAFSLNQSGQLMQNHMGNYVKTLDTH